MVKKGVVDGIDGVEAMFTSSRDVGTNRTEDVGPVLCTKGTGDLLLNLYHAYIAFDQVVVKRDAEVIHEGQDAGLMFVQAVKQVFGRRLFGSSDRSGFCLWRGRVGGKTLGNERIVRSLVVSQTVSRQGSVLCGG